MTKFDDYIAAPKDNNYQSIHTAVVYDDGKPLEVEIRTAEMDQNAEFGSPPTGVIKSEAGQSMMITNSALIFFGNSWTGVLK